MLRAPLPTTLNYYLAIHSNDSFWTVQKDQASLSAVLPTTPRRPVQTGRLLRKGVSLDTGSASLKPEGQASFEMANLRPDRTGLPFVVFISQRGGARDNVRVKVARAPRVRPSEMVTIALRPSVRVVRGRLDPHDLALLRQWIDLNEQVLIDYWNGVIGYTEDALSALRPIQPAPE